MALFKSDFNKVVYFDYNPQVRNKTIANLLTQQYASNPIAFIDVPHSSTSGWSHRLCVKPGERVVLSLDIIQYMICYWDGRGWAIQDHLMEDSLIYFFDHVYVPSKFEVAVRQLIPSYMESVLQSIVVVNQ